MKNQELIKTIGGATSFTTIINSSLKLVSIVLEVGRVIGTSVRRIQTRKICGV